MIYGAVRMSEMHWMYFTTCGNVMMKTPNIHHGSARFIAREWIGYSFNNLNGNLISNPVNSHFCLEL